MPVSVLLPFRNAAATLTEAIATTLDDLGPDDELVVVDDGSTDDGAARLPSDPRIVTLRTPGVGIAGALEAGRARCRHPHVARMDADDRTLPGRFAAQSAALDADPSLAVVAAQVALIGAPGPGIERFVAWQNGLLSPADHARSIFVESPLCHPSAMLRRSALDAVGGFRAGPFAEDYDLWLRLVAAGWSIAKLPRVLLEWRIHDANTTWNDPRTSIDALRRLRARHLAAMIGERPFGIWSAGREGLRLSRALEAAGVRPSFFVDIDPKKIGRIRHDVRVIAADVAIERVGFTKELLVIAVATRGGRDLVRGRLEGENLVERTDFVCAA